MTDSGSAKASAASNANPTKSENKPETKTKVTPLAAPHPRAHGFKDVKKRSGQLEPFNLTKIRDRIIKLRYDLHDTVNADELILEMSESLRGIQDHVKTSELDDLVARTAIDKLMDHPDYGTLATRVMVDNLHKSTKKRLCDVADILYNNVVDGRRNPLLHDDVYQFIMNNKTELEAHIVHARDRELDWFGFHTLAHSYLTRVNGQIVERPQHFIMRVAIGIHQPHMADVLMCYDLMMRKFTHATPTLLHSGRSRPMDISCFLLPVAEDSIEGIYSTVRNMAMISKCSGGIGVSVSSVRCKDSYIAGSNGKSAGLLPFLKVFNDTALAVNQAGKRPGAIAVYIEPWHADVLDILEARRPHGADDMKIRDLFLAIWLSDFFMECVERNDDWTFFDPATCPRLVDTYGEEHKQWYLKYKAEGKGKRVVKANEVWSAILSTQIESGVPYLLNKDTCNAKSNQKNLGTILSSNLCTEIVQYSSPTEIACCNLASLSLPAFVVVDAKTNVPTFDFNELQRVTEFVTMSLDRVIDKTHYPLEEAKRSNLRHRPIAIGIQGFAEALIKMRYPYSSEEARKLNRDIFETMYYGAVSMSVKLAQAAGPYETFSGSPASQGLLQFDLWKAAPTSNRYDWKDLKERVKRFGLRNSLLTGPMPTATTSTILGNTESFELPKSNLYVRRTLAGEFMVIRNPLFRELVQRGLWTPEMRNLIINERGQIHNIEEIPEDIRELYCTSKSVKLSEQIDMAADRAIYIDQSQSMNIELPAPVTHERLTQVHFYSWRKRLKTLSYYVHTPPAKTAMAVTVDRQMLAARERQKTVVAQPMEGKSRSHARALAQSQTVAQTQSQTLPKGGNSLVKDKKDHPKDEKHELNVSNRFQPPTLDLIKDASLKHTLLKDALFKDSLQKESKKEKPEDIMRELAEANALFDKLKCTSCSS